MMIKFCFLISATLLACGCQVKPQASPETKHLSSALQPVLILPPQDVMSKTSSDSLKSIEQNLQLNFTNTASAATVAGSQLKSINNLLREDNLMKDGQLNLEEALAIAELSSCRSAISWQILDYMPYPPQRLTVQLFWLNTQSGDKLKELNLSVDLREPRWQTKFKNYVDLRRKILFEDDPLGATKQVHTLSLSTDFFLNFAAHQIILALLD